MFIVIAVASLLLLFFLWLVAKPQVQAVTHAVLQTVNVLNDQSPTAGARADLKLMLHGNADNEEEAINLPLFRVHEQGVGLVQFSYSIILDEKTLGAKYALLNVDARKFEDKFGLVFVQIINGGNFYLNGNWVSSLPQSTKAKRRIWYEPFLVPLPSRWLKNDGTPNVLTVLQTTSEPSISISRIYFGDLDEVNRVYRVIYFFCSTLANAFMLLCLSGGLFFLGIWVISPKERIYAFAGGICVLWAVMFSIFRLQESSTDMMGLVRWSILACEGGMAGLMVFFIFSFTKRTTDRLAKCVIVGISVFGALVYAIGGSATERYLNLLWIPVLLMLYTYALVLLVVYCWQNHSLPAGLFLFQAVLFMMLAFHDYAVQVGLLANLGNSGLEAGWAGLFFEHIPALFLGMPFLLLVVGYMLLDMYRNNVVAQENVEFSLLQRETELESAHSKQGEIAVFEARLLERERIYQDIHDGIGSQLVKAIFKLRSGESAPSAVIDNLQACLRDLRLVIDAQPESDVDIQTTVFAFCVTQELHLENSGLSISYNVGLESTVYPDPKVTLNVLRVLQETLNNTIKHSGATDIAIKLESRATHLIINITDNGHGYSKQAQQTIDQQSAYGRSGNRGITGLALRAAEIGAEYTIDITESGTKVQLRIPQPDVLQISL